MRSIRTLLFGGLAMLAAAFFAIAPASAVDRDIGIYNLTCEPPGYVVPDVMKVAAVNHEIETLSRSCDTHADDFVRMNQPLTNWRFSAEAYSRVDPHIRIG
ncbi:hypothetical protein C7441_112170 [Pseudaminobacter salicylatoxidans]|uniref:Secreted protein n=1 Tax=Pseudaminobacter salicylatoxidans TaxID=93369 RepID=A0A316C186_PSESE|nr:hypothetical protein [Pseudaminobacter salicylatoxidans]PWJ80628.1 hypothetical protein C7441_112170 [Pseudaminobacter salicylatoxidans]